MKGFIIGSLIGLALFVVAGLVAATSLIWPYMPLAIALVLVMGLFGYLGRDFIK